MEEYRMTIRYFDGSETGIYFDAFTHDNPWRASQIMFFEKVEYINTLQIKSMWLSKRKSKSRHSAYSRLFWVRWNSSENEYEFSVGSEEKLYNDLCEYYSTLCEKFTLLESEKKSIMVLEALL